MKEAAGGNICVKFLILDLSIDSAKYGISCTKNVDWKFTTFQASTPMVGKNK